MENFTKSEPKQGIFWVRIYSDPSVCTNNQATHGYFFLCIQICGNELQHRPFAKYFDRGNPGLCRLLIFR